MTIQVLGSGCATCKKLYELTQQAVSALNLDTKVEYITGSEGTQKIIALGAMHSPLLTIDDQIIMAGFTPDIEKLKNSIQSAIKK